MTDSVLQDAPRVNRVSGMVVSSAMRVHTALGPGLLETAYKACLLHELRKQGLKADNQVQLPVSYDEVTIDLGYRMDLVVENRVVVELKCLRKSGQFNGHSSPHT